LKTSPTTRQVQGLTAIDAHHRAHGYAPTVRELGSALGIRSTNGVAELLCALQTRGLITAQPGKARTTMLTKAGRAVLAAVEALQ
jgi:repressor LexA